MINLQLFADAVKGKRIVYLFRRYDSRTTKTGLAVAFVTDNERSLERDSDSVETKDGSVASGGSLSHTISANYLEAVNSDGMTSDDLEQAIIDDAKMEIWEANLDDAGTTSGKFKGKYFQGKITSWNRQSPADDMAEGEVEFLINGGGASGDVTVSASVIDAASYVFADTTTAQA